MPRIAYVNGRYVPHHHARVHVEDRGYQFADGVYEVMAVNAGRLVDEAGHLARLSLSLEALGIPWPIGRKPLEGVLRTVCRRNRLRNGLVYIQITRGVAPRDHPIPAVVSPTIVVTGRRKEPPSAEMVARGVAVVTGPDQRWARCDIKSIALLPNILSKQQARDAGAFEMWQVDEEGCITEGTSTSAWIVTHDGRLVSRQADHAILRGVTGEALRVLAARNSLRVEERPFTVAEAHEAAEAFLTSATAFVLPITRIDGRPVGEGTPGPLTLKLLALYRGALARGEDVAPAVEETRP